MPATHAQEIFTRNLCSRLAPETCTCVYQSGTSFFPVQVSCMQLNTALFQHRNSLERDTNCATWLAGELFCCTKLWLVNTVTYR